MNRRPVRPISAVLCVVLVLLSASPAYARRDPNDYADLDEVFEPNYKPYLIGAAAAGTVLAIMLIARKRDRPAPAPQILPRLPAAQEHGSWKPLPAWAEGEWLRTFPHTRATAARSVAQPGTPASGADSLASQSPLATGGSSVASKIVGATMIAAGAALVVAGARVPHERESQACTLCSGGVLEYDTGMSGGAAAAIGTGIGLGLGGAFVATR
jgi:hypothetical protein